jgi:hypothetical protein
MIAVILILSFIILVSLDRSKMIYKAINEINDIDERMKAREKIMNYKIYSLLSSICILIILLYLIFTWN